LKTQTVNWKNIIKLNDTINDTENILNNYKEKVKKQLELVMKFVNTLKVLNYSSNLLNILVLYKTSSNVEQFFEIFSMFILYIPIFENMAQQIPVKLGNLNDLFLLTNYFTQSKKIVYNIEKYDEGPRISNIKIENITFDNITFRYDMNDNNSKNIINNFSLNINKNDKIAILAQSGSGKTTLMKLLLGFYKPQKGKILINNIDIDNIDKREIRKKINYINQKTLLLNDTIINNMKYGNNKPDNYIIDILTKYNLLNIFKNSLNYQVDISGKNISLGMQKVIFLMRGILKEGADVYIFDEPLTSLDKNTRKNIINLIHDFCKDKTLIIITHDNEILSIVNKKIYI
jgi:ABC-type multidrug transport system fused ATPase/permease subunit